MRGDGGVLLNSLVKPLVEIEEGARTIHGIEDEELEDAPGFPGIYPRLREVLEEGGLRVIVYNSDFDRGVWEATMVRHGLKAAPERGKEDDRLSQNPWECAMTRYGAYVGAFYDDHGYGYRYQRLPGGVHSSLGDARAALALIRKMAEER